MTNSAVILSIFVISFLIGNQMHERYHYWVGRFFGANPKYAGKLAPVFPTRTVFRNRDVLSKWEVQAVSIPGHLFFVLLVVLAIIPQFPSSYTGFALVGVAAGGGLISWTDDMAARNPEIWLKFND
ncbi:MULTISPECIES: hypothetical protein [Haloarcula]|uniref:hypothetical protein n=1 Tax=Haloarcula TaxID=2237 RepID=UPI0023EAAE04|nr:hypothetical protein [Halomicroarcula sp. XH51]